MQHPEGREGEAAVMTMKDIMPYLHNPDRVQVIKDGEVIFTGYKASLEMQQLTSKLMDMEVESFRTIPEIKHKKWKELGLMKPLMPEETPEYSFSDLQLTLYYTIGLKSANRDRIEELRREIAEHEKQCDRCPERGLVEACECCDVYGCIRDFERELENLEE